MKNFFNAIGVAYMEKVHSAMIAWILDDANDVTLHPTASSESIFSTFPQDIRSRLLCKMFGVSPQREFKSIRTHVEWNDIDIMIETKDDKGKEDVWVIENKLKTQEHLSNEKDKSGRKTQIWQTEKYVNIIRDTFPNRTPHYMLLSLGGDKARSTSEDWLPYTYSQLHQLLSSVDSLQEYVLVKEYVNAIGLIVSELEKFLNSKDYGNDYPNVFLKTSKAEKAIKPHTPVEAFIIENGLETIFQKQLLAKMIHENLREIEKKVHYDERNGTAMFVLPVSERINGFEFNIEFQGGTYKVSLIHEDYINEGSYVHTDKIYGVWDKDKKEGNGKVYKIFRSYHENNNWSLKVSQNLGKKDAKPKPRIALVKSIKNWYDNPQNDFVKVFNDAKELANSLRNSITKETTLFSVKK